MNTRIWFVFFPSGRRPLPACFNIFLYFVFCPFPWESGTPVNIRFLGPIRVYNPNGIWISSSVFAGLTVLTNGQLDRQTDRPCINRSHLCTPCMRCGLIAGVSLTVVKFADISRFSRKVVTLVYIVVKRFESNLL